MNFLWDYFTAIDILAILAIIIFALAAFIRKENVWLGLLAVVVVIWGASRIFGLF